MIRSLRIQRFRSILDAELEFGRVNLFIGGNGAGKSNVLEALGIVSAVLDDGVDAGAFAERGVRLSRPHFFKSSFKNRRHSTTFYFSADFDCGDETARYRCGLYGGERSAELSFHSEALDIGDRKIFSRTAAGGTQVMGAPALDIKWSGSQGLWNLAAALTEFDPTSRQAINEIARYAIFSPQTAVLRGLARVDLPRRPLGLSGSGLARCIAELLEDHAATPDGGSLREALDSILGLMHLPGWTNEVDVGEPDPYILPESVSVGAGESILYFRDRFMRSDREYLSPYDASEGTLYLAFVAALMGHASTPPIFALDNVDGTLNPGLVRKLVEQIVATTCSKAAREHQRLPQQVFLTTHNPTALDAFDLFDPDHRVFVVYRDMKGKPKGTTQFYRLQPPPGMTRDDWVVTHKGLNLSELWIEGRIREALG